jgi:hypothetical protein
MAAMIADSTALFRYQGKPIADSARPIDHGFASTERHRTARSGALVTVG